MFRQLTLTRSVGKKCPIYLELFIFFRKSARKMLALTAKFSACCAPVTCTAGNPEKPIDLGLILSQSETFTENHSSHTHPQTTSVIVHIHEMEVQYVPNQPNMHCPINRP